MELLSKICVMRRCSFLGFLIFFSLSLRGQTERISFTVEKAPLEQVLLLIEKQTDFSFIYTREAIALANPVTVSVKNETLENVLAKCFEGQPLSFTIENKHIILKQSLPKVAVVENSKGISGKLVDATGLPISGATITIRNTGQVTTTSVDGEFNFPSILNDVIIVITGAEIERMEIRVRTGNYNTVQVKQKVSMLDETMVIAYGKTTRRLNTGTIGKVSREEIMRQPVGNPLATMAGRVAGLQIIQSSGMPGSYFTVRLRGQNSIANGNDPLYIIDGVPYPSTTISGPILSGGSINSSLNFINPSDIESIEVLKDAEATAIYGSRGANGVILITTRKGSVGTTKMEIFSNFSVGKISRKLDLLNRQEYLEMRREAFKNDGTVPTVTNARDLLVWDTTRYTDWQEELIGNTMQQSDIKISVSGGSEQTQFLLSGGHREETTVLPGPFREEKFSFSSSIQHQALKKKLKLSFSTSFLQNNNVLPERDVLSQINLPPVAPEIFDSLGNLNWANNTWTNPYSILVRIYKSKTENFLSNLSISYNILSGLELKVGLGYNGIFQNDHQIFPKASFSPNTGQLAQASFGTRKIETMIFEPQIFYNRLFGKLNVKVDAGLTLQSSNQKGLYMSGTGYASDELLGSLAAASSIRVLRQDDTRYRYSGVFSRINLGYRNKYLLSLSARRDGSSRYGPQNRFANFGSISSGWIISNESWMRKFKFLSFAKLKGSIGTTGNDQIGDFEYLDTYAPTGYSYQGVATFYPTQLFSPDYGWETVRKIEAGLELGFFKDKVLITTNYYHNTTTDQLIQYSLPVITGFQGVLRNLPATILNNGFEFEINATLIQALKFSWVSSFNISFPHNKLVSFESLESSSYANIYMEGQSLFMIKRYHLIGVNPTTGVYEFEDYDRDGKISNPNDMQSIVFTGQQYFGGLANNLVYGKWSLNFFIQFVRQKYGIGNQSLFGRPGGMRNMPRSFLDRWQNPGDITNIQKFTNSNTIVNIAYGSYVNSDGIYEDASFIRLKNVELAYTHNSQSKRAFIKGYRICFQGQNLITLTKYQGADPETKDLLPTMKLFSFGLSVTF